MEKTEVTSEESERTLGSAEGLSIHGVTQEYGTDGLVEAVIEEISFRFSEKGQEFTLNALDVAQELHADENRTNGPYVDHVLRVGLRVLWKYEVFDRDLLAAALLHDAVENQEASIAPLLAQKYDKCSPDDSALDAIARTFSPRVADLVDHLTLEKEVPGGKTKNEHYYDQVVTSVTADQGVALIKLSDFVDNACGNHYTEGDDFQRHLDEKYFPLYDVHIDRVKASSSLINEDIKPKIIAQLVQAKEKAWKRLYGNTDEYIDLFL